MTPSQKTTLAPMERLAVELSYEGSRIRVFESCGGDGAETLLGSVQ